MKKKTRRCKRSESKIAFYNNYSCILHRAPNDFIEFHRTKSFHIQLAAFLSIMLYRFF